MTLPAWFGLPELTEDERRRYAVALRVPFYAPGVRKVPHTLTVIQAPTGEGKTYDMLKALQAALDLRIAIFAPTVELGLQIKSEIEKGMKIAEDVLGDPSDGARTVGQYLGLAQPDPKEKRLNPKAPPICEELDLAKAVLDCASDPKTVCVRNGEECHKAKDCRIRLQDLTQNEPDILVAAHAFSPHPVKGWDGRDVVFYDEDAANAWFKVEEFEVGLLEHIDLQLMEKKKPSYVDVEELVETLTDLSALITRVADGRPLTVFDFPGYHRIEALHATLRRMLKRPKGDPNPDAQYVDRFKKENAGEPKLAKTVKFVEWLLQRLAETCSDTGLVPGVMGCLAGLDDDEPAFEVGFVAVPHEQYHAPSFLLSATPQTEAYGRIFKDVKLVKLEAEQPTNIRVIRVIEKGTMTQLKDKDFRDKVVDVVVKPFHRGALNTAEGAFDMLLVAKKEIEQKLSDELKGLDRLAFGHFGALQGKNDYRQAKVEVIVGIRLPVLVELKVRAETIKGAPVDLGDPDHFPKREFTEAPKNGGPARTMYDYTHRDPVMRALLRSIVHAEIVQADRLRARRRPEEELTLVMMNTVDLSEWGVVVDEHLVLNENRHWYQAMAERGIVPDFDHPKSGHGLNALIFGALPDIFKDVKQVANVRAGGSTPTGGHGFPSPQTMWVWPKGARGREPVLVNAPDRATAAELLRKLYPDARDIKARNRKKRG